MVAWCVGFNQVMQFLAPGGRLLVAGDSQQLPPIRQGSRNSTSGFAPPRLPLDALGSSIMNCLEHRARRELGTSVSTQSTPSTLQRYLQQRLPTVVMLKDNYRMNKALCAFTGRLYEEGYACVDGLAQRTFCGNGDVTHPALGPDRCDGGVDCKKCFLFPIFCFVVVALGQVHSMNE